MRISKSNRFIAPTVAGVLAIAGIVGLAGCDTLGTGELDGNGRVRILLTDAPFPFDLVSEARVTITSVEIVRAGGDVIILSDEEQTFNLLDLRDGVTAEIGEGVVEPGVYTHARLRVSDAAVIMKDGAEYNLKVPSSRIKILLPQFEVDEEGFSEATLDFHVEHSFVVRGIVDQPGFKGFIFKPVVKAINITTNSGVWESEGDIENDLVARGAVEALAESGLSVDGLDFEVNAETTFEGIEDLSSLSIGDRVKISYMVTEEGDLVATRIEPDDDDDSI